jgi:hypothetical protein
MSTERHIWRCHPVNSTACPVLRHVWEEYALDELNNVRYLKADGSLGIEAGCPREKRWPPDKSMAHHCIWPLSTGISMFIEWEGEPKHWVPVLETVEAGVIREILKEHAEEVRLIEALERHLGLAVELEVA